MARCGRPARSTTATSTKPANRSPSCTSTARPRWFSGASDRLQALGGIAIMQGGAVAGLLLFVVLVIFAIIVVAKSIALIPQAEAAVIERLGRYSRTVSGQLTLLVPFIDRVRAR